MADRLRRRFGTSTVISLVAIGVLLYLVLGPLVMLVLSSFEKTENVLPLSARAVWSLANYGDVFLASQTWLLLLRTLVFGGGALLVGFGVGVPCAWLIERTDLPFKGAIFVLLVAPSGIPTLITAIGWSLLLNPTNGILNLPLQNAFGFAFNVYSLAGMILVEGFSLVPLTFLLVTAAFRGMNGSLEDAASMSGASLATTLRRVTLPLLTPAILGAIVYVFVNVIEAVDVPLVLGLAGHVTVLSTQVYLSVNPAVGLPNYGISSTYGILLLALAVGPLFAYNGIVGRSGSYATVSGKAYRPRPTLLGRWRWPVFLVVLGYVFVTFALPFLVLLWTSIEPYYAGISSAAFSRITFEGYAAAAASPLVADAVVNTLVVGIVTAAAAMALAAVVSRLIVRSRSRAGTILDILAFTPHAMPGVVIGLAVLLIYLLLPLPIYGSIWILVIALATQSISLGTRLTTSGIAQVQESLEEAGAMSGAGMGQIWRRILIPLLRPSLINGYLLIFLASIQNLTLALMLYTPHNTVLSTLIWSGWNHGDITGSAVLSVAMTVITVVAAVILRGATSSSLEA